MRWSFLVTLVGVLAADDPKKTKARVEEGEGVPFFDERFSCREGGPWSLYKELVEYARLQIFDQVEGEQLARDLSTLMADRTSNLPEVLQCNVGVIAGYHLLARRSLAQGDDWKAYRQLQLALIWVFTLRNALQVPEDAARDWATRTDRIVQEIKLLKKKLEAERQRRLVRLPQVSPSLRVPGLRVAVVSICAYPEGHPLVLRDLTPKNRRLYADRHNYGNHVHMVHPMPGEGIHIQHAKLQLIADYLRSGDYDWVAWLDCDSILMNLNRTLDSIIYRYARRAAQTRAPAKKVSAPAPAFDVEEPLESEVLEGLAAHVGSCNTDSGCKVSTQLRVNPRATYLAKVRAAQVDMESESEKLASVSVGGKELGECNPSPDSDYDCRLYKCFEQVEVPPEAVASGVVTLEAHSVRTHNDCRCSRLHGTCYSANMAALAEVVEGEKTTDPSYGMFVRFTLEPLPWQARLEEPPLCSCRRVLENQCPVRPLARWPQRLPARVGPELPVPGRLRRIGAECDGPDMLLGISVSLQLCLELCKEVGDCRFVSYGIGKKRGQCHWELNDCLVFEEDSYVVFEVLADDEAQDRGGGGCSERCLLEDPKAPEPSQAALAEEEPEAPKGLADDGVDLLITEEGWGLSSANWLIRRSNWSIAFLESAFEVCHKHMPLFGDQDCMIHLLMNPGSLQHDLTGDSLDSHAVIVPQRELNAYDALNAHYMGCDGYEAGDLLVTFPGCKDAKACNPLFELAAAYARGEDLSTGAPPGHLDGHRLRLFGPPELAAEVFEAVRHG